MNKIQPNLHKIKNKYQNRQTLMRILRKTRQIKRKKQEIVKQFNTKKVIVRKRKKNHKMKIKLKIKYRVNRVQNKVYFKHARLKMIPLAMNQNQIARKREVERAKYFQKHQKVAKIVFS